MRTTLGYFRTTLAWTGSAVALAVAAGYPSTALSQTAEPQTAAPDTTTDQPDADKAGDIVVTGSRISRAGFDQPTPTTVIGDTELREGARPNLALVLNDQPQFKPTTTPATSTGATSASGAAPVDLRGLGSTRTLVLLNGRRFVGDNNLNLVPTSMVDRVEVVTGGASAAWGSGAIAGVVNIILKDDLKGVTLGAQSGVSSRGDGQRYSFDGSFGTSFADGKGHFMVGAEYVTDKGIPDRSSRPNLNSPAIITISPGVTKLVEDVNYTDRSHAGVITSGILSGQTFNSDGTLRPWNGPNALGIGGSDAVNLYDDIYATTPFDRLNVYARVSYDVGRAKFWADASYGRATTDYPFFPDLGEQVLTISATNPFLSQTIRNQLAAAGQTSFTFGRLFKDSFSWIFNSVRESKEGAIGVDGSFGSSWKYHAHFSHGQVYQNAQLQNSIITANFNKAINAATNSSGQIVCAVNADASTANDDPACAPINPFGENNISAAAHNYVAGAQQSLTTNKLDSTGVSLQGDLFRLWAGPVTIALGAEARWESQVQSRNALSRASAFIPNVYSSDLNGGFNVKEGFVETAVPLLDLAHTLKLDFNSAARYSYYSTSGGIWSWKLGGTARLFQDLLLRVTRSRDIRSPTISELFSTQRIGIGPTVDLDTAGRLGVIPGYNPTPATVTTFQGGNPNLVPEIGSTLTIGGSYSPSFIPGFSLSVDYYDIKIAGAITTLSASNLTLACKNGSAVACGRVVRDPVTQTLITAFANAQNIASIKTRGIDVEASYVLPLSHLSPNWDGALRFRTLATYISTFDQNTGVTDIDTAGDVGDSVALGVPHWRGTFSASYEGNSFGIDARARYVGGGKYDHQLTSLINNSIAARTYFDLGGQVKVKQFELFANVDNLFNVNAPLITTGSAYYDIVGTYVTMGARVKF
jgi:outer membrane receptor protein involved in Fe transport